VFNGERFLAECIESVLAQSYPHWDYTIVDNCSTDRTLEIASKYAALDPRITVRTNEAFVPAIANHNIAFRSISPGSTYCKLLSADDWMYAECLEKLVALAERNPAVGIVGSYSINVHGIKWTGLPHDRSVFDGRDVCRRFLLGDIDTFWVPSTVLYRSALVRASDPFYPRAAPSADLEACLRCLGISDFGFVHQILSYERVHDEAVSELVRGHRTYLLDRIEVLKEYGPMHLTATEYRDRLDALMNDYYGNVLANALFNRREGEFWKLHQRRLAALGYPMFGVRLGKAVGAKLLDLAFNPKQTIQKMVRRAGWGAA